MHANPRGFQSIARETGAFQPVQVRIATLFEESENAAVTATKIQDALIRSRQAFDQYILGWPTAFRIVPSGFEHPVPVILGVALDARIDDQVVGQRKMARQ